MSELLKKQKFGVEIEFTGITILKASKIVAKVLSSSTSSVTRNVYNTRTILDNKMRKWKIMRDGSICAQSKTSNATDDYKVEFVTPPLSYEDIELLQTIIRELRKNGAIVNNSCGIHIHIDGANHNAFSLRRLLNFMVSRQDLIYESLNITHRKERWCKPISDTLFNTMKKEKEITKEKVESIWYSPANDGYCNGINHEHYNSTRYHGINLHSFFSKGTVEFRLFNSTLHAGVIKSYIQFCLALSAWAIESNDKIVFRSISGYTANQKVTIMYNILTKRLRLFGEEFKTCRFHMMKKLKENINISNIA